jgi:uncharacterized membrane protein YebE (DUF533 family)
MVSPTAGCGINLKSAAWAAYLQGAADSILNYMAQNPVVATGAGAYRAFRKGERAQQPAQQPAPAQPDQSGVVPTPLGYNYGQF